MRNKGISLIFLFIAVLISRQKLCHTLDPSNPAAATTCTLKDSCELEDSLLTVGAEQKVGDVKKLEGKIASVFEDKVNYSMQIFADETILDYSTLEANLSSGSIANFTLKQLEKEIALTSAQFDGGKEKKVGDDDDIVESERGKWYQYIFF